MCLRIGYYTNSCVHCYGYIIIREQEKEIVNTADKKDSEKRAFNWKTIGIASMFAVTVVGIGAAALGGNFNVKLPKKS